MTEALLGLVVTILFILGLAGTVLPVLPGTPLIFLGACGSNDRPSEWRMPSTESFVIRSRAAHRDYQIMVALPRGYSQSQARYPALYVLDANGMFPLAVETLRFMTS